MHGNESPTQLARAMSQVARTTTRKEAKRDHARRMCEEGTKKACMKAPNPRNNKFKEQQCSRNRQRRKACRRRNSLDSQFRFGSHTHSLGTAPLYTVLVLAEVDSHTHSPRLVHRLAWHTPLQRALYSSPLSRSFSSCDNEPPRIYIIGL